MEHYGQLRYMDPSWSTEEAVQNASSWGWRWHYRALTVQRLLASYVTCFLEAEGVDDEAGRGKEDRMRMDGMLITCDSTRYFRSRFVESSLSA